jgi:cytochrome c oxidase assembly protein subunit 11
MRTAGDPQRKTPGRDLFVAALCGAFVALMGALSYAAVPLFSWFYRDSGVSGTTEVVGALPRRQSPRLVSVRFDSDLAAGLPWSVRSPRNTAKLGQVVTVSYRVTPEPGFISVGEAGYYTGSPTVGLYFEKINCFCCAQIMQTGESHGMAVVLYVDPKLANVQDGLSTITLFQTFHPARLPGRI